MLNFELRLLLSFDEKVLEVYLKMFFSDLWDARISLRRLNLPNNLIKFGSFRKKYLGQIWTDSTSGTIDSSITAAENSWLTVYSYCTLLNKSQLGVNIILHASYLQLIVLTLVHFFTLVCTHNVRFNPICSCV